VSAESILDEAYKRGGWPEARRCALSLRAAAESGVLTVLAGLDTLIGDGVPYKEARKLVDELRAAGKAMGELTP
jgi:hypothetical protein